MPHTTSNPPITGPGTERTNPAKGGKTPELEERQGMVQRSNDEAMARQTATVTTSFGFASAGQRG